MSSTRMTSEGFLKNIYKFTLVSVLHTMQPHELGSMIVVDKIGTVVVLPDESTIENGWHVYVKNNVLTSIIVDSMGNALIDGQISHTLAPKGFAHFVYCEEKNDFLIL